MGSVTALREEAERLDEHIELPKGDPALGQVRETLTRLLVALRDVAAGRSGPQKFTLADHGKRVYRWLMQILGNGVVRGQVRLEDSTHEVRECLFAGIWRVHGFGEDWLEVAPAPELLAVSGLAGQVSEPPMSPTPRLRAQEALADIRTRLRSWQSASAGAQVLNLSLMALDAADRQGVDDTLGTGRVTITVEGLCPCLVEATGIQRLWRVRYQDLRSRTAVETLEIATLPEVVVAKAADMLQGVRRLEDIVAWIDANG